jgi:ABC transporter substrate binding protein
VADEKGAGQWKAYGMLVQGWILALTGRPLDTVQMLTSGLMSWRSTGATQWVPLYLSYLARAYAELGQFDDTWRSIREATTAVETTEERWLEAEVYRTAGEIALMSPHQEILIEAVPELRRLAILADKSTGSREFVALQDAARARGVELLIHQIASAEEITAAIDSAKASGAAALNVLSSPFLYGNRQTIMQRVAALRLPAIYQFPEEAEEGGFVAYGPRLIPIFRELVAEQLVKLLRGVKPADIPIEQPTKFELVINLKTANAMGITVPATLLARADKVIE